MCVLVNVFSTTVLKMGTPSISISPLLQLQHKLKTFIVEIWQYLMTKVWIYFHGLW